MLASFRYVKPETLEAALDLLDAHGQEARVLAGGTDLLVLFRRDAVHPSWVVDIKGLPASRDLSFTPDLGLSIGPAVTVNQLAESPEVRDRYRALAQAAGMLASYQVRNRATVVGNMCNASPGADLSAPLLVFETQVQIASKQGSRAVPLAEFFTGVKRTSLIPGELVTGLTLAPAAPGERSTYLKQARLKGHDLGIVGLAARVDGAGKFRLAMAAVAPTPIRLHAVENLLNSQAWSEDLAAQAAELARQEIKPISDTRASAEYRLHVTGVLVRRALSRLMGGKQDE